MHLTQSEFKLVAFLAREPGRVYRAGRSCSTSGTATTSATSARRLHVSNIRRKIERDPDRPERLVTVRGAGYKLNGV